MIKQKKLDSFIISQKEKGIFPSSLYNPLVNSNDNISIPIKNINKKPRFKVFSLENNISINNNFNYNSFSKSNPPDFTNQLSKHGKTIIKEIKITGKKRSKNKLYKNCGKKVIPKKKKNQRKSENIQECNIIRKDNNTTIWIMNDKLFDFFFDIYENKKIDMRKLKKLKKLSQKSNKQETNKKFSCICLKSKCLNNYCKCHKNRIICNKKCKCCDCQNSKEFSEEEIKNFCKYRSSPCLWNYSNCKRNGISCGKKCYLNNNCINKKVD